MKIELLVDNYSSVNGLRLSGKGIHDVPAEKAKHLLSTFPDWFQAVEDQDPEETNPEAEPTTEEVVADQTEPAEESVETVVEDETETSDELPIGDEAEDLHIAADEATTDSDSVEVEVLDEIEAPEAAQDEVEPASPTKHLSKMNKDEMQALAAQIGAEVNAEMTGDQMRAAIKAAQEAA